MKKFLQKSFLTSVVALGCVGAVYAQGLYVGGGIGQSSTGYNPGNQNYNPAQYDDNGFAWHAFMGYQLNPNFALEGSYNDYSDTDFNNILGVDGANSTIKEKSLNLIGRFIVPFGQGFSAFANGGMAYVSVDRETNDIADAINADSDSSDSLRPTYGLGVAYNFYPGWSAMIQWNQIPSGGGVERTNMYTLDAAYHFG